ncbi:MAG: TM0106 family RecB-like putative nuclease [Planctomycetes bacterium]|nr:TM0106 family RecB-like putative nuclease [Planctomycetota bacterium]
MISDSTRLLLDFVQCRYKALLARRQEPTQIREFHCLANRQQDSYAGTALDALIANYDPALILRAPASLSRSIRRHHRLVLEATCLLAGHEITLPPIEANDSKNGAARSLTPIFFCNSNKVSEGDKLVACVLSLLIADQIPHSVQRAKIIYGDGFDARYVALRGKNGATRIATEARHVLDAFLKFLSDDAPPPTLQLNRHCDICEFRQRCRDEAIQKDDLSLLSGLYSPEITQWKAKGILTITQLAHTFQPRRYCRPNYDPKQHSQPLQALAVKQQTVFIRKTPTLPNSAVRVYLDVEGVPDDNRFYLIGMIREDSDGQSVRQFWAGSDENEQEMWQAFTNEIETLPDEFSVFHYGSYERTFIQTMLGRHGTCGSERIGRLTEWMCDVHRAIRTNVFFPAYSNRL